MFSTGSQRKYWMFKTEDELMNLRYEANVRFIDSREDLDERLKDVPYEYFLSPSQERNLICYYEKRLRKLCLEFQPPMPRSVVGTAFQFYKRFYLNNSVMDYHPKHILVTCVYLACKVEEFNVSMAQFVANIKGDRTKAADIVLNNELLLMQELKYHLTVHNPFRPVEGFLIDLKTRAAKGIDPEKFRPHIDTFIDKVFFTDACLLYSPSQIALASVVYAASMIKCGSNIEDYLTNLFADDPKKLETVQTVMRSILNMIKSNQRIEGVSKDQVIAIERKLENCRNQSNNPDSREYRRALQSQDNDEEPLAKYAKLSQEMQRDNDAYLNPPPLRLQLVDSLIDFILKSSIFTSNPYPTRN